MPTIIWVFLGGGLGSICRCGISSVMMPLQLRFPWATLTANALACAVLGYLLATQMNGSLPDSRRFFLMTGFCGGFSTFSTFTAESWGLFQSGNTSGAIANVFLNLLICTIFLLLGLKIYNYGN